MNDALDHARLDYLRTGRGCIVSLFEGDVRCATMAELAARLGPAAE
jgi:hypothetical protein